MSSNVTPTGENDFSWTFLNPTEEIAIHRHHLPHWQQGAAWQFVTWRLADALPKQTIEIWKAEREHWLKDHPQPWIESTEREYHERFSQRLEKWLDAGHGSCLLRKTHCAEIVANAFHYFVGKRYGLGAFVVMPNHVHVLFQPKPAFALAGIIGSWKSFTAKKINRICGRTGTLWQEDYWDRIIRHKEHWEACRRYILENPKRLPLGTFVVFDGSAGVSSARDG